jgi:hypothetical protein
VGTHKKGAFLSPQQRISITLLWQRASKITRVCTV